MRNRRKRRRGRVRVVFFDVCMLLTPCLNTQGAVTEERPHKQFKHMWCRGACFQLALERHRYSVPSRGVHVFQRHSRSRSTLTSMPLDVLAYTYNEDIEPRHACIPAAARLGESRRGPGAAVTFECTREGSLTRAWWQSDLVSFAIVDLFYLLPPS